MICCNDVSKLRRFTPVGVGMCVKCTSCESTIKLEEKTYYWMCKCGNTRVHRNCDNTHAIDGDTFIVFT